MKIKHIIVSILLLGSATPALAGGYSPMPSKVCLRSPECMASFEHEELVEIEPPMPEPHYIDHGKPEPVKKCAQKPGGWSELEFYEQNTWYFQTWGRLMTVEEKEAFRCGWPA